MTVTVTLTLTNLQAFRVPFDGFAHLATIELVVDAVTATKDYSVFGSKPLEILLTFKWRRYHGRAFMRGLVSYATYLSLATAYNIEASRTVHRSVALTPALALTLTLAPTLTQPQHHSLTLPRSTAASPT